VSSANPQSADFVPFTTNFPILEQKGTFQFQYRLRLQYGGRIADSCSVWPLRSLELASSNQNRPLLIDAGAVAVCAAAAAAHADVAEAVAAAGRALAALTG